MIIEINLVLLLIN